MITVLQINFFVINGNSTSIYCGNDTVAFEGFNLIITFISTLQSRFYEIKTNNDTYDWKKTVSLN